MEVELVLKTKIRKFRNHYLLVYQTEVGGIYIIRNTVDGDIWILSLCEGWHKDDPPEVYLLPPGNDFHETSAGMHLHSIDQAVKTMEKHIISNLTRTKCKCVYCKNREIFLKQKRELEEMELRIKKWEEKIWHL